MEFQVADLFEAVVDNIPSRESIVLGKQRLTFADLDKRANKAAHMLKKIGVRRGEHIGIYAYNCIEWIEVMVGAYKIGAVPININYRYVEEELTYLIENADLVAVIFQSEFAPLLKAIKGRTPKLRQYIHLDELEDELLNLSALKSHNYVALVEEATEERSFEKRSGDDIYVLYTGGTTGLPKGVMWRQEDVIMTLGGGIDHFTGKKFPSPKAMSKKCLSEPITALALAPLMHGAAQWQTFNSFFSGWKLILNDRRSFDATYIWKLIAKEKVQNLTITGDAMGRPLADALPSVVKKGIDISSLVILSSTAAIFSPVIKDEFLKVLPELMIIDGVGSTETGSTGMNVYDKKLGKKDLGGPTFKKPKHSEILDLDTLKPLNEKDTETIGYLSRSGNVPIGYYKDPKKSSETFIKADGVKYSIPGDLAKFSSDGQIILLGRGSVSINSGGEKIFPEEVEAALKAHPNVFDCLVVGTPDKKWGEKVTALLQTRNNKKIKPEELKEYCRTYIASYKFPKKLLYVDSIKRSPSGKPDYTWAKDKTLQQS